MRYGAGPGRPRDDDDIVDSVVGAGDPGSGVLERLKCVDNGELSTTLIVDHRQREEARIFHHGVARPVQNVDHSRTGEEIRGTYNGIGRAGGNDDVGGVESEDATVTDRVAGVGVISDGVVFEPAVGIVLALSLVLDADATELGDGAVEVVSGTGGGQENTGARSVVAQPTAVDVVDIAGVEVEPVVTTYDHWVVDGHLDGADQENPRAPHRGRGEVLGKDIVEFALITRVEIDAGPAS